MIFNRVWERYILWQTARLWFVLVLGIYFIYVLIDYSLHSQVFSQLNIPLFKLFLLYGLHFSKRADLLIPFAFLLASIKVLCSMNVNRELVALLAGGISKRHLMRPLFALGILFTLLLYLNFEVLYPLSLSKISQFEDRYFRSAEKMPQEEGLHELALADNTKVIYQGYDSAKQAFFDAYWILSADDFYRIKYLYPYDSTPRGHFVDHLQRNSRLEFERTESFDDVPFPSMHFDPNVLQAAVTPLGSFSISALWKHLSLHATSVDDATKAWTLFYAKLAMPLICLLVVIGPAPYCLRFSRNLPVFLICCISIFAFITFFTLMDSAVIVGQNGVLPPSLAVWGPVGVFFAFCLWNYRGRMN